MNEKTTLECAYDLLSLLRCLSLAMDGQYPEGPRTLVQSGGCAVLDLAADMAGEIVDRLDLAEREVKSSQVAA